MAQPAFPYPCFHILHVLSTWLTPHSPIPASISFMFFQHGSPRIPLSLLPYLSCSFNMAHPAFPYPCFDIFHVLSTWLTPHSPIPASISFMFFQHGSPRIPLSLLPYLSCSFNMAHPAFPYPCFHIFHVLSTWLTPHSPILASISFMFFQHGSDNNHYARLQSAILCNQCVMWLLRTEQKGIVRLIMITMSPSFVVEKTLKCRGH